MYKRSLFWRLNKYFIATGLSPCSKRCSGYILWSIGGLTFRFHMFPPEIVYLFDQKSKLRWCSGEGSTKRQKQLGVEKMASNLFVSSYVCPASFSFFFFWVKYGNHFYEILLDCGADAAPSPGFTRSHLY